MALDTIHQFLKQDPLNNKAIYVGYSQQAAAALKKEGNNLSIICVPDHNDALAYFAPFAALKQIESMISQHKCNILLVFDEILTHHFKEKKVFDQAGQPFSPVNILNEIQTRTGIFDNYTLTTIGLFDSDSTPIMFKTDEEQLEKHLDSLADH